MQDGAASQGIDQGGQFDSRLPEQGDAWRPLAEENFFDRIEFAQDGLLQ